MLKPKILVIEDDLSVCKDISFILENFGYDVKSGCTRADEAIEILTHEKFDLVIIDDQLSFNSKGVEVGNYLLKNSSTPYIYLLSTSNSILLEEIKESRPHGIVFKPFISIEIPTLVSIVLNNQRHLNIDILRKDKSSIEEAPFILKNIIEYVKLNIYNKIEIIELAKISPWSYDHFIKIFSKYLGKSPYQYVLHKKIEKSKAEIISTDLPITEIAVMLSFESYSNFINAFKREVGCTPYQFRKANKANKYLNN